MNKKILIYPLLFMSMYCTRFGYTQITTTDGWTGDELAESLVGYGVTISGVTLDCPDGMGGKFECLDCSLGMDEGIVLTSGGIDIVEGPNNSSGATGTGSGPGDPDLEDLLPGYTSYDACVLEFDVTATSDSVKFEYVFGSEEYLEWVGSSFNDVFGFFISGPGITGTQNIALIPGTTTPVSINNVNDVDNPEYYVDNGDGWSSPYSTDDYYVQYDGLTVPLIAKAAVIPCETYHLKLAVSDMGDGVLDSGVFIKAGSLSSPGVFIEYSYDIAGYPTLIEDCNNGQLDFTLSFPPIDTIEVNLIITGTATNGIDNTSIPTLVQFLPGDTIETIYIEVFPDGVLEGIETIVISGELSCAFSTGDSIVIEINDYVPLTAGPDTIICPGESVNLFAEGGNVFIWDNYETLNEYVGDTVIATPIATTNYVVTAVFYQCLNWDTVTVEVEVPEVDAGPPFVTGAGITVELQGSGGVSCVWEPSESLDEPTEYEPNATPETTTTYYITVTSALGCEYIDSTVVTVIQESAVTIPNAFSPNGDGINDDLNIVTFDEITLETFDIYDRWGTLVFSATDITDAWDGTYLGKEQEIGSYVYIFVGRDYLNREILKNGTITLLR
jgi:gliding motility-associated-like protein